MEEFTREFLNQRGNEDLSEEEFHLKLGEYMERRGRAAAPTAPMETAAAPPRSIGMFMPSTVPELRGRENLPTFLQRFRTWASISGCDSALDSEIIVRTSGTPRAELERVHDPRLVDISLNAWQSLTKALEKEQELLKMVIRIGSISEAWRALTKIANASEEVEYDRAKREFETLEMDASESVAEFFTRVHVILMELERHQIPIPDREIQRIVLGSLSPRFPHETSMHAYKGECGLKRPGDWACPSGEVPVGPDQEGRFPTCASRCLYRQRRSGGWRWYPWTRQALRQALGQAPRRWSR